MIIGIIAILLFVYLGFCIAKEAKCRQRAWALLFAFAGWASVVVYATNLAGFWGKTFDTSAPVSDGFMIPFCAIFFTLPLTIPLIVAIREIWRAGGGSSELPPLFFDEETSIGILYCVSLEAVDSVHDCRLRDA